MPKRILVCDDEQDIRDALEFLLSSEGYDIDKAESGKEALDKVKSGNKYDCIILDIIMPVMNGTETAKQIRTITETPILFLTAKSSDEDKTEAYTSGGDDYLSKPFSSVELQLRIKALIKRGKTQGGDFEIDDTLCKVRKNGKPVTLTDKEFDLLKFLMNNSGEVFSNSALYENVWGEKYLPTSSNTVMVHILNLRKKLEDDPANPRLIITVWGKGYCYVKN